MYLRFHTTTSALVGAYLSAIFVHADVYSLVGQEAQAVLSGSYSPSHRPISHPSDPAGHPNVVTRIEVTSNGTQASGLYCAWGDDKFESGFAHFTNNAGEESEHLFWWLFKARHDPENAPVVVTFGGGPGGSGMLLPFSGAGPCIVKVDANGHGRVETSPFSWTEYVNLLAIDHPVGVGFSHGTHTRNSSATAAWDIDDFLQEFWKQVHSVHRIELGAYILFYRSYPHLAKNEFMVNGGSYGGTYLPNVIDVMYRKNLQAKSAGSTSRVVKMPESIMMVNVWSDPLTHFRWMYESVCNPGPDGHMFFNTTLCDEMSPGLCAVKLNEAWAASPGRDPYDYRTKCPPEGCSMGLEPVGDVLNSTLMKDTVGVSRSLRFDILNRDQVRDPFVANGDMIQPAYLLLAPAIEDGMRIFVYNGMQDGIAPWRSSLAWMRLLKTKYQGSFRSAQEVEYPGVGTIRQVGSGAGNYTFVKIRDAGHMVIRTHPKLLRHLMINWLKNKSFF